LGLNSGHLLFNEKYNALTDDEILSLYSQSGDNAFIGILYNRYGHLVLGLCLKYLKNKMEAEDSVIQIFTGLISDLRKHRVQHFKSWLYVYSKNHCLMELRKRQATLKKELELQDNVHFFVDFPDPQHLKEKETQMVRLEEAIGELCDEQKTCITLFYLEKRSYNEIAAISGFSAGDVKSHIQNGKRNLKIKLERISNERT
jgi:RNA polymerase sigma-70 factor (ECF subfamily)